MKRKDALAVIRAEVAREGRMTQAAMRAYVETRSVGILAFQKACDEGMVIHRRAQQMPQEERERFLGIGPKSYWAD